MYHGLIHTHTDTHTYFISNHHPLTIIIIQILLPASCSLVKGPGKCSVLDYIHVNKLWIISNISDIDDRNNCTFKTAAGSRQLILQFGILWNESSWSMNKPVNRSLCRFCGLSPAAGLLSLQLTLTDPGSCNQHQHRQSKQPIPNRQIQNNTAPAWIKTPSVLLFLFLPYELGLFSKQWNKPPVSDRALCLLKTLSKNVMEGECVSALCSSNPVSEI